MTSSFESLINDLKDVNEVWDDSENEKVDGFNSIINDTLNTGESYRKDNLKAQIGFASSSKDNVGVNAY